MTDREQFEAWYRGIGSPSPDRDLRQEHGRYINVFVAMAYRTWQAAIPVGQAQAARRCADIVGSVNNYDNPMTAGDCVDAIKAEFAEAFK